jgi:hypothetical protein
VSDAEKIIAVLDEVRNMRERCAKIAAIEAQYWGEVDDERIQLIAIGAMGAASNICVAILTARTPEQHKAECQNRGKDLPA